MFYLKLAVQNIKSSLSVYAPFLMASTVLFMILSMMIQLMLSPIMTTMGSGATSVGFGVIVLTLFALIIENYSFNFLMNQRAREFGLYNMLGMNKRKVSLIASIELWLVFLGIILVGSLLSAIFSNVLYLIFTHITHYFDLSFSLTPIGFIYSMIIFTGIFIVLQVLAIIRIGKTSPIILFTTSVKGEKEPKGNVVLAILGIGAIGVAYFISLTSTAGGVAAIGEFFIAVLLVIVGTYLFYISFLAWLLKTRRKNKKYFYQPKHFIGLSQMIFRLKHHAVGLANITLLAVMSFVAIASTTILYSGSVIPINERFPKEASITFNVENRQQGIELVQKTILNHFPEKADERIDYLTMLTALEYDLGDQIKWPKEKLTTIDYSHIYYTFIMTQDDFRKLGNELPTLAENQIAFGIPDNKPKLKTFLLGDTPYQNIANLDKIIMPDIYNLYSPAVIVVSDDTVLNSFAEFMQTYQANRIRTNLLYRTFLDLSQEAAATLGEANNEVIDIIDASTGITGTIEFKEPTKQGMLAFTGGFLFTGFLLGISFLLGAALIIYYKQYTEGNEDKKSYHILQELGMNKKTIKQIINSQTLMVFFMPLGMATLHFVVALVMIKRLFVMFGITSSSLIYTVSGLTILVIAIFYFMIYRLTSRIYYRMIKR